MLHSHWGSTIWGKAVSKNWPYADARFGTGNFPAEALTFPTGRLKKLKNSVFLCYFARLPLTKTENFLHQEGLDAPTHSLPPPKDAICQSLIHCRSKNTQEAKLLNIAKLIRTHVLQVENLMSISCLYVPPGKIFFEVYSFWVASKWLQGAMN